MNAYQGLVYARIERTAMRCEIKINRPEMEDICAEVFTNLIKNDSSTLRSFEGKSKLSTWLSVIAHRVCLRELTKIHSHRGQSISPQDSDDATIGYEPQGEQMDALSELINAEDQQRVKQTLKLLSVGDREILIMFYNQQLGYAEIGKRLGVSINTVGPKLHRAQKRLKKLMRWV